MANDPFLIGDHTILQMRNQSFALDDDGDYGTIVSAGGVSLTPTVPQTEETPTADPMARLEQKLDAALRAIDALQRRLDSLDISIARMLARQ